MEIAALCLSTLSPRGGRAYELTGDWSPEVREACERTLGHILPQEVDAMYNTWVLALYGPLILVSRRTWTSAKSMSGPFQALRYIEAQS